MELGSRGACEVGLEGLGKDVWVRDGTQITPSTRYMWLRSETYLETPEYTTHLDSSPFVVDAKVTTITKMVYEVILVSPRRYKIYVYLAGWT